MAKSKKPRLPLPDAASLLRMMQDFGHGITHQETVVMPAMMMASLALMLSMIPFLSTPLVHLLGVIAIIMGIAAWLRKESRFLCIMVFLLAALALLWRYMFLLGIAILVTVFYSIWRLKYAKKGNRQTDSASR